MTKYMFSFVLINSMLCFVQISSVILNIFHLQPGNNYVYLLQPSSFLIRQGIALIDRPVYCMRVFSRVLQLGTATFEPRHDAVTCAERVS